MRLELKLSSREVAGAHCAIPAERFCHSSLRVGFFGSHSVYVYISFGGDVYYLVVFSLCTVLHSCFFFRKTGNYGVYLKIL